MRKWFESGLAFFIVAVINIVAGLLGERSPFLLASGAFFLIAAITFRARHKKQNNSVTPE